MTAVEWLYEQIQKDQYSDALSPLEWIKVIEQAKEMEKQQIIDAWESAVESEYNYHINSEDRCNVDEYYNETYGSKGSDETLKENHIVDTNEMVDQVPDVRNMVEISDEEIEEASNKAYWVKGGFMKGAKWYREQLKKKQ